MLDLQKDFDQIETLVYAASSKSENDSLGDWQFAVGNEMWCELLYRKNTVKEWQRQLMQKATEGIAFETYLRPYSDEKGNIYFGGNYKNSFHINVTPKSRNTLAVCMQNLDTGHENIQYIQESVIDEAIKNEKRVPLQFV